jgi:hypothetical protein
MKNKRFLATSFLIVMLTAVRAWAGHVVWVDFSGFHLNCWEKVNGNSPAKSSDINAIKKLVVANMTEDYATFDVTFTTVKPANGRYTRVKILGMEAEDGGLFGCAAGDCCKKGDCTGFSSWNNSGVTESACEVYSGSFASDGEFTGSNATTFRIANGISHTASHELGHVLGLSHCHAADDSFTIGCGDFANDSNDDNARWHIMASGSSWELSMQERATRDRFFSAHSERRKLGRALQLRNHFAPLANVNGGSGFADLTYGHLFSPSVMKWGVRLSDGSDFGSWSEWSMSGGGAGDIVFLGDVDGDERADLVYGRIVSPTQVTWFVRESVGYAFSIHSEWSEDGGDVGDFFRLADVDGDKKADLVYGRPISADTVRWFVRKSNGYNFESETIWAQDGGNRADLFFLADVDDDEMADLVFSRPTSGTKVQWFVRRSDGEKFGASETFHTDAGDPGDLMYVGDATGDGKADLLYGRIKSSFEVTWYFRRGTGSVFESPDIWSNDSGDAGDLFRLGDTNGDGNLDLMYGRPLGLTSLTATPDHTLIRWYGRASSGTGFNVGTTWLDNGGDEGDYFP